MQELRNKILEFTSDGPPGVGQWIELGELAKKAGVKKTEMEKMVEEVLKTKVSEVEKRDFFGEDQLSGNDSSFGREELTYERTDYTKARDSFQKEMEMRQNEEFQKLEENPIQFDQPEVVFPELNVTFPNEPEKPVVDEKIAKNKDQVYSEIPTQEMPPPPEQSNINQPTIETTTEFTFSDATFNTNDTLFKEPNFEELKAEVGKDDLMTQIAESNRKAREQAEKDELERLELEKKQQDFSNQISKKKQGQKNDSRQKRRVQPAQEREERSVSLADSKKVRTIGIVALIGSFIFSGFGLIAGIFGYRMAMTYQKQIKANDRLYGNEIKQNVNLGVGLSIAGMVIGGIKIFDFIAYLF